MNRQSSGIRTITTILVMIVIATGITWLGYHSLARKTPPTSDNPYEYDIETYRHVPVELIHYTQIRKIQLYLAKPRALAVTFDKRLIVSGDSSILVYTPDGQLQRSFTTANAISCLAVDQHFNILSGVGNHIEIYDTTGSLLQRWQPCHANSFITSIAALNDNVYAADAGKQIVLRYDQNGNLLNRIGERDVSRDIIGFVIPSPYFDVAVDEDGFIWAVNTGKLRLENYTPTGALRSHWGISSIGIEGFSGCCNPSHFALMSDGSFVTAEKGLERVKVYNRAGQFVCIVAPPSLFTPGTVGLDVAVDTDDCIYVLDPSARVVRVFQHNNSIAGKI